MNRTPLIIFVTALLFALAALIGYVVWFGAFSVAQEEARQAAAEVVRIEREDAAIADAQETIEALATDEAALRSRFVSESGIVAFLEELENSGQSLGSMVDVIAVTPPATEGGRLTLALRIQGGFGAVVRTLGSIEHGPRDIRLSSLTFDTPPGGDEPVTWIAAATFTVGTIENLP